MEGLEIYPMLRGHNQSVFFRPRPDPAERGTSCHADIVGDSGFRLNRISPQGTFPPMTGRWQVALDSVYCPRQKHHPSVLLPGAREETLDRFQGNLYREQKTLFLWYYSF